MSLSVNFVCLEQALAFAAAKEFSQYSWFSGVHNMVLKDAPITTAIITPGNSWGRMDGTFDLAVAELYPNVPRNLQAILDRDHAGILMPGNVRIVNTHARGAKWVVYTPTMIVPSAIIDPTVVYAATHAAFAAIRRHNARHTVRRITSVTVTGMGVGTGKVSHSVCVRLMAKAINDVLDPLVDRSWEALMRHRGEINHIIQEGG